MVRLEDVRQASLPAYGVNSHLHLFKLFANQVTEQPDLYLWQLDHVRCSEQSFILSMRRELYVLSSLSCEASIKLCPISHSPDERSVLCRGKSGKRDGWRSSRSLNREKRLLLQHELPVMVAVMSDDTKCQKPSPPSSQFRVWGLAKILIGTCLCLVNLPHDGLNS